MMEALLLKKMRENKAAYDQELRKAAKDIIFYMYLNAVVRNQAYAEETGDRSVLKPAIRAPFPLWKQDWLQQIYWY